MVLRVDLGVQEGLPGDHIILDVVAVEGVEESPDQGNKLSLVLLPGQQGGGHLLVEEDAAGDIGGGQLGHALEHGGGAVGVHGVAGGTALGQGLAGVAAVGGGQGASPLPHIGGNGGGACVPDAADGPPAKAGVGVLLYFVDVDVVGVHHQLIHIVVVVAVLGGLVDQQLADPLPPRRQSRTGAPPTAGRG